MLRAKKKYKRTVNAVQNAIKEKKVKKLASIEKKDSKTFWKIVHEMSGSKSTKPEAISPTDWLMYFKTLYNNDTMDIDRQFAQYIKTCLPVLESTMEQKGALIRL